jgi:hypothetical protein
MTLTFKYSVNQKNNNISEVQHAFVRKNESKDEIEINKKSNLQF